MIRFYTLLILLFVAMVYGNVVDNDDVVTEDSEVEILDVPMSMNAGGDYYEDDFASPCNGVTCGHQEGASCDGIFYYGRNKNKR